MVKIISSSASGQMFKISGIYGIVIGVGYQLIPTEIEISLA